MAAGWHELEVRAKALAQELDGHRQRLTQLATWLEEGSQSRGASHNAGADTGTPELPDEAVQLLKALSESISADELVAAQEQDRLEDTAPVNAADPEAASTELLHRAESRVVWLEERAACISDLMTLVEEVTNWTETFRKANARGKDFDSFEMKVADTISKSFDRIDDASTFAAETRASVAAMQTEFAQCEARAREAKERKDREDRERQEKEREARELHDRKARERTPAQLRRILNGDWLVEAINPMGVRDVQRISLKQHRFGSSDYAATSQVSGWQALGSWKVLDASRVRVDALSSPPMGGPPMLPFTELFTVEVVTENRLQTVSSPSSIRMDWARQSGG